MYNMVNLFWENLECEKKLFGNEKKQKRVDSDYKNTGQKLSCLYSRKKNFQKKNQETKLVVTIFF